MRLRVVAGVRRLLPDTDLRILRALRAQPKHGYALVAELAADGPAVDRATVYRRLAALARGGWIATSARKGRGAVRREHRLAPRGEQALREELRRAMELLLADHHARLRRDARGSGMGRARVEGPVVFVSGSRISAVEARILASFAASAPRRTHLVLPPGVAAPASLPATVAVAEAPWSALPFRDAYARLVLVNELPPARGLARAAREWARVLARSGTLHVVAPAPLPRGVDPFVDYLAALNEELFPDVARAPAPAAVERALASALGRVEVAREGGQIVWTARRRVERVA